MNWKFGLTCTTVGALGLMAWLVVRHQQLRHRATRPAPRAISPSRSGSATMERQLNRLERTLAQEARAARSDHPQPRSSAESGEGSLDEPFAERVRHALDLIEREDRLTLIVEHLEQLVETRGLDPVDAEQKLRIAEVLLEFQGRVAELRESREFWHTDAWYEERLQELWPGWVSEARSRLLGVAPRRTVDAIIESTEQVGRFDRGARRASRSAR